MDKGWQELLRAAATLRSAGRNAEAIAAYQRLMSVKPDLADSWYNLGWLCRQERRYAEALKAYQQAIALGVDGPEEVLVNCAAIHSEAGDAEAARASMAQALALNPSYLPALLNLGNLEEDLGRRDEARAAYGKALEIDPGNRLALARLAGVSELDAAVIAQLEAAIADSAPAERADLGFALGRLLDRAGRFDEAFAAYRSANEASRQSLGPGDRDLDRAAHRRLVDRLIDTFQTPVEPMDEPAPLFIVGMFRSGSTLAERILAGHSRVRAGGELDLIPYLVDRIRPYPEAVAAADPASVDEWRQFYLSGRPDIPEGHLLTDKRPDNFLHIGLIKTLFPSARIVHTVRDPLDNLLSLYFLHLNPLMAYALDLDDSAEWYGQYRRLMEHWKSLYPDDIFDLDYDALVREPRPSAERLFAFCRIPFEEQVLRFSEGAAMVRTASVWQVREPLHTRSSGRWRSYREQMAPVAKLLGRKNW